MPIQPIRYMIAEDHRIFRESVMAMLDSDRQFRCIGQAGDGVELLALLEMLTPDVILLDFAMPKMDGLATLRRIRQRHASVPVVMLTLQTHPYSLNRFIEAGASGILVKEDTTIDEIKTAMQTVLEKGYHFNAYLDAVRLAAFVKSVKSRKAGTYPKLSEREVAVLRYICQGQSSEAIGALIHASPRTVERIRSTLLQKTNSKNLSGLIVFAMQTGLYLPQ